jgi:hypothetical protein
MSGTLTATTKLLTKAKMRASEWMPYFSHVLFPMRGTETTDVPTMCVDEYCRLYYNPEFIGKLSVNLVAYVLLHEVLHVALSHHRRRTNFIPDATPEMLYWYNVAADLAIQQMLAKHHQRYEPKDIVSHATIHRLLKCEPHEATALLGRGWTTERYFEVMWAYVQKQKKQGQKCPKPGQAGQPQPSGGPGQQPPQQGQQQQQQGQQPQAGQPGDDPFGDVLNPKDCGSNSDGKKRPWEKKPRLADAAMVEGKLREAQRQVNKAEQTKPGSTPGGLAQSLKVRLEPQPDPFKELEHCTSNSVTGSGAAAELTYAVCYRRQQEFMARMRGPRRVMPECTVIVDTSGSMNCGDIRNKALVAVSQGLRKVHRPRVICFDAAVHSDKRLGSMKDFKWIGNGGTNMAAAVEMTQKKHRPDAIVVITDGETGWPQQRTRAKLIIALCKKTSYPTPSWAKVVHCYREAPTYAS